MRLSRRIPSGREHGLSGFRLAAPGSLAAPDFPHDWGLVGCAVGMASPRPSWAIVTLFLRPLQNLYAMLRLVKEGKKIR